jgi:integrase
VIPKSGVGILKPKEVKLILKEITNPRHRVGFLFLLLSGMRYVEAQRLQKNPKWIDPDTGFILLPEEAQLKAERSQLERTVRLTPLGREMARQFVLKENKLPSQAGWNEDLKRWAKNAGIETRDDCTISSKTLRKTCECWLTYYFKDKPDIHFEVALSQGHDSVTQAKHYINTAFTEEDRSMMKEYVEGWI